ncbi:MAG: hypothetical protein WDO15_14860 [Bacteroidota bacterium]
MEVFVRLKNWQIFLIVMLPLGSSVIQIWIFSFFSMEISIKIAAVLAYVRLAARLALFLWLYLVGIKLNEKIGLDKFDTRLFSATIIYMAMFITFEKLRHEIGFDLSFTNIEFAVYNSVYPISWFQVVSWISLIYSYYFVAKVLLSAELGRRTSFGEFVGSFFLMLFILIGIWWIQPRINEVFSGDFVKADPDTPLDHQLD